MNKSYKAIHQRLKSKSQGGCLMGDSIMLSRDYEAVTLLADLQERPKHIGT